MSRKEHRKPWLNMDEIDSCDIKLNVTVAVGNVGRCGQGKTFP